MVDDVVFSITSTIEPSDRKWYSISNERIRAASSFVKSPSVKSLCIEEADGEFVYRRSAIVCNSITYSICDRGPNNPVEANGEILGNRKIFFSIAEAQGAHGERKWSKDTIEVQWFQQHPIIFLLGQSLYSVGCTLRREISTIRVMKHIKGTDDTLSWSLLPLKSELKVSSIVAYALDYDRNNEAIFWFQQEREGIRPWRFKSAVGAFEIEEQLVSSLPTGAIPASFANVLINKHLFIFFEHHIQGYPIGLPFNENKVLRYSLCGQWQSPIHLVKVGDERDERLAFVAMDSNRVIWCRYFVPKENKLTNDGLICFRSEPDYMLESVYLETRMQDIQQHLTEVQEDIKAPIQIGYKVEGDSPLDKVEAVTPDRKEEEPPLCFFMEKYLIYSTGSNAWKKPGYRVVLVGLVQFGSLFHPANTRRLFTQNKNGALLSKFLKNILRGLLKGLHQLSKARCTTQKLSPNLVYFHETDKKFHYPKILVLEGPTAESFEVAQRINYSKVGDLLQNILSCFSEKVQKLHERINDFRTYLMEEGRSFEDVYEHPVFWNPGEGILYFREVNKLHGRNITIEDYEKRYGGWNKSESPVAKIPFIECQIAYKKSEGKSYEDSMDCLVLCVRDGGWHAGCIESDMQDDLEKECPSVITDVYDVKGRASRVRYLESDLPN